MFCYYHAKAIHHYKETEKLQWTEQNNGILGRVRNIAFPPCTAQIKFVHVLEISKDGYVKPHIDAVRVSILFF